MLTYNTHLKQLKLPEYGRNIQNMVDHCLTIEDRDERTQCAHSIVNTMSILFPASKSEEDDNRKFWDHLAIMSDFKLDIDWPVDVIRPDEIEPEPDRLPYDINGVRRRQYGSNIEHMINAAADMEESDDRLALVALIASQMKKNLLAVNKDDEPDERIYRDIFEMSDGRIRVDAETIPLADFDVVQPAGKKKKKK